MSRIVENRSEKITDAHKIVYKWESYRDAVKRFFLTDKVNGQKEYDERIALIQKAIKGCAKKEGIEEIQAVILIAGKEDGMMALQVLAAGFELCNGNDLTDKRSDRFVIVDEN